MKKMQITIIFFLALLYIFLFPENSLAGINLPWSTTFDCAESDQSDWFAEMPYNVHCDGLGVGGTWTCSPGNYGEQITSAANNSGGGGGRGQRQWVGDGTSNNSGSTTVNLNSTQTEIWIRWYMRYPLGFAWTNPTEHPHQDKWIYIDLGAGAAILEFYENECNIAVDGIANHLSSNRGWTWVMGGSTGDGLWHSYEAHIKLDTNGNDGIAQMWVDGELIIDKSNVDFNNNTGWTSIAIGSNQQYPNNGGCRPVDFDDIAISNTGYIGPINQTPDTTSPAPPGGVIIN